MAIAVYPGSFDPITLGHVDIVRRISSIFDEVIVLVAVAEHKEYIFTAQDRVALIQKAIGSLSNVKVEAFTGLTVDYAKNCGSNVIVRGIRGVGDMENEMAMAHVNKKLNAEVDTLIALADPVFASVSSRLVKEVAKNGGSLKEFVPPNVAAALLKKFS